jgi:tetratricopeptide (TPR) repeat protein
MTTLRASLSRFVFGMALLAFGQAAAVAQDTVNHLSATDLFSLAEKARTSGQFDDAVKLYDALANDPDSKVRAEARFRKGMMLIDQHRYAAAAVAFRALLDEKPDAVRVRLELARVMALMGDELAARRELRQAEASGLPPDVEITVEQFNQALRSRKSFGGSFEFTVAPDSNINRATQARTLDTIIAPLTLSDDARARSGIGVKASGQAFLRFDLTDRLSLLPRVSGLANVYRAPAFDDISSAGLIGLEWREGKDRVSPSVGLTQRWYGGRPYASTKSFTLNWLHPSGKRQQFLLGGSVNSVRYTQNALQDGALYTASVNYDRALTQRSGISTTINATRQTARDPGYATWSGGGSLLYWRQSGRSTAFVSVGVQHLEGDAALFLFPQARREWLENAQAGVTLRRFTIHGFAPVIRVSYERNTSTVGLYAYHRVSSDFGITRSF